MKVITKPACSIECSEPPVRTPAESEPDQLAGQLESMDDSVVASS